MVVVSSTDFKVPLGSGAANGTIQHAILKATLMKRRLAFDAQDLLMLLDALDFEFNYYTNPDHLDLGKAANAYSMAHRIAMHKPGRLSSAGDLSETELRGRGQMLLPLCQRNLQEWRAKFNALRRC
jgi:hypothetical protein